MNGKTPISALQEAMASQKLPLPIYREESQGFLFKCTVEAAGMVGVGTGPTKKAAKHASAQNCLAKLTCLPKLPEIILLERSPPPEVTVGAGFKNHVGELNEFASKNGVKYPEYQDCVVMPTNGKFFCKCSFLGKEEFGSGANKKEAKQDAAMRMLAVMKSVDPSTFVVNAQFQILKTKPTVEIPNHADIVAAYNKLAVKDPVRVPTNNNVWDPRPDIEPVNEEDSVDVLKARLKHYGIQYDLEQFQRNPFVMYVRIKGTNLYFCGVGVTKEQATVRAFQEVLKVKKSGCSLDTNDLIRLD